MVGTGAQTPPVSYFLGWAWFPWAPCLYKKGLEGWSWGSFQAGPLGGQPSPSICMLTKSLQRPYRPLLCPWDSPGKSTRVGCHALLQGIFPTQARIKPTSLPSNLHWQPSSLPLAPSGKLTVVKCISQKPIKCLFCLGAFLNLILFCIGE